MSQPDLRVLNATVVTADEQGRVSITPRQRIDIEAGVITSITAGEPESASRDATAAVLDARHAVVMPAFVDCHTHACWAGERLDEWTQKLAGATYLELLNAGGGIMSTVRAVRGASQGTLEDLLVERLGIMLDHGTATAEVKSGYGLTTEHELKMLRAIVGCSSRWPGTLVPTACIGHAIDPDQDDPINQTIRETLPAVNAEFPGVAIDAYCEKGAWSLEDCLRLFERAAELGHPIRVHADQFNDLGMIPESIRRGFVSVDHLEASTPAHLEALGASEAFGVMLPCAGFHVDDRYGDGRRFLDAGGRLAIATNVNPGSAPCSAMPMAMALAARHNGLTPAEAFTAATHTPAQLLGFHDRGRLAPGQRADLLVLRTRDYRSLAFEFGANPVAEIIVAGRLLP